MYMFFILPTKSIHYRIMPTIANLQVLAQLITRNKIKDIPIITAGGPPRNKSEELYHWLLDNPTASEEMAAQYFYQNGPSDSGYVKLKNRLEKKLLNTLFFIDINQPNFSEIQRAYYECHRNLAQIKILVGRNATLPMIPLAEKTLSKALRYEFMDIALLLLHRISKYYSNVIGKKTEYFEYSEKLSQVLKILIAEIEAEKMHSDITVFLANSRGKSEIAMKYAAEYSRKIDENIDAISTYRFIYAAYSIKVISLELTNNFEAIQEFCDCALRRLAEKEHVALPTILFNFQIKKLVSYIQLNQFSAALKQIDLCKLNSEGNSHNRFVTYYYSLILFFHHKEYQSAFNVFKEGAESGYLKQIHEGFQEFWRVFEAFIFYFWQKKKITLQEGETMKNFRISKFINNVPIYSQDKEGVNITILILHILFLLEENKINTIIDRVESLKAYTQKYLRKNSTYRSMCFINMLLTLPSAHFHPANVRRKADPYWKKLKAAPIHPDYTNVEVEIVPYETLWEFVLESIDKIHKGS